MKTVLYSYYRSSSSYRVRIALHYLKVAFEYCPVHLLKDGGEQHSEEFKKLNPSGEVPVLFQDNHAITQSLAIFWYLDEAYGKNTPLFPVDRKDRIRCIELCETINSGIQPLQNLKVLQKLSTDFSCSEEQKKEWIQHWISRGLTSYEKLATDDHPGFSVGHTITAADMFLIPQLYNAHRFEVSLENFPKIKNIEKNCLQLECFQTAHPDVQPDRP